MSVRGVVSATSSMPFGNKVLHSFRLQGDNNYYNTGERVPPVEVGKSYEFETSLNAKGKHIVDLGSIRPWEGGEAIQAAPAKSFGAFNKTFKSGKSEEEKAFWANREARETRNDRLRELGATRNTALSLISLLLANGAVKLPAKESAKETAIYEMLEHYTDLLMNGKKSDNSDVEKVEAPATSDESWS